MTLYYSLVSSSSIILIFNYLFKLHYRHLSNKWPATSTIKSQSRSSSSLESLPFLLDLHAFETLLVAHPSAAGLPGRTLWDKFLEKLWGIDSLNALHEFFANRTVLLAKNLVSEIQP